MFVMKNSLFIKTSQNYEHQFTVKYIENIYRVVLDEPAFF